ncbi:MAG: DedA family protein [Acidimicrobiales bacterium]
MQHLVSSYGLLAIFILMVGESAALPIPSELVMTFAGYLASTGKLSIAGAILAGTLGNLVGSYITWIIGRYLGRAVIVRLGKFVLLRDEDLARAERWFERRGDRAVLIGRVLPVIRTFVSLPAGAAEMPLLRFGIFTFLGSIPFNVVLVLAGYYLGSHYETLVKIVQDFGYLLAVAAVAAIAYFFYRRFKNRRSSIEPSS